MKCRRHGSLLSAYLDDRLDDAELAAEIQACPQCRPALRLLARSRAVLASTEPAMPAADLAVRATRAALAPDAVARRPSIFDGWVSIAWPSAATAAAAAALLMFVAIGSAQPTRVVADSSSDPLGVLVGDGDYDLDDDLLALEVEQ